jgi:UDP-N-acetylmuramoylalanine--D-glutamate ligase
MSELIAGGKTVAVMGAGISGVAAARLLLARGHDVCLIDDRPLEALRHFQNAQLTSPKLYTHFGAPFVGDLAEFACLVVSPGVALSHPVVQAGRKAKTPILSEIDLAWMFLKPIKAIGITGTNGKSTTTSLVAHLLRQAGLKVFAGGNLGEPLCDLACSMATRPEYLVLELSSYQLETIKELKLEAAVILNLSQDHVERHQTLAGYAQAKAEIFSLVSPGGLKLLNDLVPTSLIEGTDATRFTTLAQDWAAHGIVGSHNQENASAAILIAQFCGLSPEAINAGLKTFTGLPHRCEKVGIKDGVEYVNDSKGTNVVAVEKALTMSSKPTHLLLGGIDKGEDFGALSPKHFPHVVAYYVYGQSRQKILKDLKGQNTFVCENLAEAVSLAQARARPGELILLSPACASWDQFANFAERGELFKSLVRVGRGELCIS